MVAAEEIRENVTDWFTSAGTCFLLGAGCSKCAGKPLIQELTEQVMHGPGTDKDLKKQFDNLESRNSRPPTIEDLMNYLVRYHEVLSSIKNVSDHKIMVEDIDGWLQHIKKKIAEGIGIAWEESSHHERFLRRVSTAQSGRMRDIFCLNYDTILEASLDHIRVPYIDGFRGAVRGWFDSKVFDENERAAKFRIFKLHGSVSWVEDGEYVRRRASRDDEPAVVYPSSYKRIQTQYGVYEFLMEHFRKRLRDSVENNRLIVLGYSFNDEHINRAISDAIKTRGNNLTVIAFVRVDKNNMVEQERFFQDLIRDSDQQFNVFLNCDNEKRNVYLGNIVDSDMGHDICCLNFSKFELITDYIS